MLSKIISKKVNNIKLAGIMTSATRRNFHSSKPCNEIVSQIKFYFSFLICV